ncbi:GNAT family N-acetyltransferase [Halostella sp. JP-L12]|uniref:GNAT family N-acetyltransferase n=1 Tax=Halostella TaxID=1843185 RepID=UPI000EF7A8BE|nr:MULTISPECIES: GNAT family N-acetyltransferase [Halostella]NHN48341.1 GNAT family N-acetyltransferase [Halostella sp. JP-L12]
MSGDRIYPDETTGGFEPPPLSFEDREGRDIEIRAFEPDELDAVTEMYADFDPADRAQGIPPTGEDRIETWLETLIGEGLNVVAWHGDRAAGHATLVPDGDDGETYELAIFVLQEYQEAGIGSQLMECLLGHGEENDVERVWLTVERWNRAAVGLYEKMGFETSNAESFELEMSLRLH